jgi:hypothetical protein
VKRQTVKGSGKRECEAAIREGGKKLKKSRTKDSDGRGSSMAHKTSWGDGLLEEPLPSSPVLAVANYGMRNAGLIGW